MEFEYLRPMGVGEILDTAFRIVRARFKPLVIAIAIVTVPLQILQVIANVSVPLTNRTTFVTTSNGVVRQSGASPGAVIGLYAITLIVSVLSGALAQGASIRIIGDRYLGTETSWQDSLRFALRHLHSIVWLSFLVLLTAGLGLVLCIVPGVYLWVGFALTVPILLIEGTRGPRAMGRSRRLVSGRWWPTFGTLLVILVLTSILTSVVGGFTVAATLSGNGNETVVQIVAGVLRAGISILIAPLSAAVTVVLYFDLRIRKEGFDVALMAQRLGVPAPPTSGWVAPTPPPPGSLLPPGPTPPAPPAGDSTPPPPAPRAPWATDHPAPPDASPPTDP